MHDWTTDFFAAPALDAWQRSRSLEETLAEVAFLERALGLEATRAQLLDLACGDGRHAVELVKRGHAVTGIDIAQDNQARARRRAEEAGGEFEFVLGDMRDPPRGRAFGGAYCMGNSFGYFPRQPTQRFLEAVAACLAPGARFVVDTATVAECILVGLHGQTWQRVDDDLLLLLECDYDPTESRLSTTYTSLSGDRVTDRRTSQHFVFTSGELAAMLDRAGFDTLAMEADPDGADFELGADRLLLTAERR